jgi:hypothetical protein
MMLSFVKKTEKPMDAGDDASLQIQKTVAVTSFPQKVVAQSN